MFPHESIVTQPIFFLFIAFSGLLVLGFYWGRKANQRIALSALEDLVAVVKPDDQTFTNIGGVVGYHANLFIKKKSQVQQVDATITLLSRHAWLYFPISKLIMRHDRLFITVYLRDKFLEEGHLIEKGYSRFRGPKIANAQRLSVEDFRWGAKDFLLYYHSMKMRESLVHLAEQKGDPGSIRHIAMVPEQKKGFVFMIPQKGRVGSEFAPVYRWIASESQAAKA
jgi:hypothetical protein